MRRENGWVPGERVVWALIALLVAAVPAAAFDDGLLYNGFFNASILGWQVPVGSPGTAWWTDIDPHGDPLSGALSVSNDAAASGQTLTVWQCVHGVVGGERYELAAIVGGIGPAGRSSSSVAVGFYSTSDCQGSPLATAYAPGVGSPGSPSWVFARTRTWTPPAPAGSSSAMVRLLVTKHPAAGTVFVIFDDVQICTRAAGCTRFFADGVETGNLEAWSSWAP